jgi:ketosteroid isomerase-like protein
MEKSSELIEPLLSFYEAYTRGDIPFVLDLFSRADGALVIGTDPGEWWAGSETIRRVVEAQMEETGGVGFAPGAPQAYCEGTVGWIADRPTFTLPDGTERPVRITAVLRQEDDGWKIVQFHGSFGIPNEEAFGQELPQA